ncbi:MAG: hypothetical protein KKE20_07535 [Nanoarchaeota archaeon]|nr:hypothetical protein [Nanoarchaeota archaeon]
MLAVRQILKIISLTGLILAVIISIFGFIALKDASEFKEKFPTEPNLFLLVEDGDILAGANNLMHENKPTPITSEEKAVFQQIIDDKDFKDLIGKNYKVFIVGMDAFKTLPEGEIADSGFTKSEAEEALRQDDIKEWYIDWVLEKADVPEEMIDDARDQLRMEMPPEEEIRATMFFLLLAGMSEKQGATFIIREYQTENIDVYPETILFRFVKIVPESFLDRIEGRMST